MNLRWFNATLTLTFLLGGSVAVQNVHGQTLNRASTVEVTPLGSHQGEFCRNDRALMFEDQPVYVSSTTLAGRSPAAPMSGSAMYMPCS